MTYPNPLVNKLLRGLTHILSQIHLFPIRYDRIPIGVSKGVFPIAKKIGLDRKTTQTRLFKALHCLTYKKPLWGYRGYSAPAMVLHEGHLYWVVIPSCCHFQLH